MSKEFKFNIGADPEFNIEMNNQRLNAQTTIRALLNSNTKFSKSDSGGYKLKDKKAGTIGWDGHSSTGEIRPEPSNLPAVVVTNLKDIFDEFHKVAPMFELSTLSRTAPIGGHIHFEIKDPANNRGMSVQKANALHKRLASFYLPIIMGENKVNLMIRLKGGYGQLCSNRQYAVEHKFDYPNGQPGYTYELRCPSAEWMTTPKIANATLAYLGVIFHEITNNPKKFEKTCKDIIIRTDQQGDALQTLALAEYKALTKSLFGKIQKYIKTFELYGEFKEEVDYILNPQKVLADKQAANYDIRIGWGLKKTKKEATKKRIISDKAFQIEAKKQDLDIMSQFVRISYNEDMNVETFAKAITKRSIAFNWNLKKSYYLFGIRKGIKDYIVINEEGKVIKGLDQCKTIMDNDAVITLANKVRVKAVNNLGGNYETIKLNFSTGKVEKLKSELIIVGIPYEERLKEPGKNFIELIYDIEKDEIKQRSNKEPKIDDTTKEENEKGEIYKIINGIETANMELARDNIISNENEQHIDEVIEEILQTERETETIQTGSQENTRHTTIDPRLVQNIRVRVVEPISRKRINELPEIIEYNSTLRRIDMGINSSSI